MSFDDLRARVLDPALCASCGACELACPQRLIRFDGLAPRLVAGAGAADCGACSDCLAVCPGLDPETPAAERALFDRTRTTEDRWFGIRRATWGAHARSREVFERSSSGGATTALLQAGMRHLELDAVLVMGREAERPWRSAPAVRRDPDELPNDAQSTYQLAPYLGALRELLLDERPHRIGVVGLACHVQALRKLQRSGLPIGERARARIVLAVELACSSGTTPGGTETLITDVLGLPLESVASVRYREGAYPGQLQVVTKQGEQHRLPFWRVVRHFAAHKTRRCLACGDWMSGLADLSVADGDPNVFDTSLGLKHSEKHGMVFVRTELGARVFEWAVEHGALTAWPVEPAGLNLGLARKQNRRASYERAGDPIPAGPIPGYRESIAVIADEVFLNPASPPEEGR